MNSLQEDYGEFVSPFLYLQKKISILELILKKRILREKK